MSDNRREEEAPPTKRLDKDGEEQLIQRLYYTQQERDKQWATRREEMLKSSRSQKESKKMTKEEEADLTKRMYDLQIQRFQLTQEEQERRRKELTLKQAGPSATNGRKKMTKEEVEDQVKRMYEDEIAKSQRTHEELTHRYLPTKKEKTISKAELDACVSRLYTTDWEKRDEELFKKYVYPYDPKTTKISDAEIAEMANRLSTRNS